MILALIVVVQIILNLVYVNYTIYEKRISIIKNDINFLADALSELTNYVRDIELKKIGKTITELKDELSNE